MSVLPEIKLGNWYFVVTCPACERQEAIGPAPSQQPGVHPWAAEIQCGCGTKTLHQPNEIRRLQAYEISGSPPSVAFRH